MSSSQPQPILLHVGTDFSDDPTHNPSNSILRIALSPDDGTLSIAHPPIVLEEGYVNPGWLSEFIEVDGKTVVFVALEDDPGRIQAYTVNPSDDGNLTPLGPPVSTVGRHPCYASIDSTRRWLFVSNYTEGSVAVLPIRGDGSLGAATDSKHHQGGDLIPKELSDRQEGPHAHCIVPHPSNRWVVVCDLGLSTVFVYAFDAEKGSLVGAADDARHLRLPAESGPRHCVWDAGGTTLFINNELTCTVTAADFDRDTGTLKEVCTVPVLPPDATPDRNHHRGGSDIALHPNGRFLYVGCRSTSPGTIAILSIDGLFPITLRVVGHESTRGEVPRNFKLIRNDTSKECRWLVVGNQESNTVVSYEVNETTGLLEWKGEVKTGGTDCKPCNILSSNMICL